MSADPTWELVIVVASHGTVRQPLLGAIITIGADPQADICIAALPAKWAIVTRSRDGGATLTELATRQRHPLVAGDALRLAEGITVSLQAPRSKAAARPARGLPLDRLTALLADAESPREAVSRLLETLVDAVSADSGAAILREPAGFSIPVAVGGDGQPVDGADLLLSDTLVLEVLGGGEALHLDDAAGHDRYAVVPSVATLGLRAVVCMPMLAGESVVGALFLGRRDPRHPFSARIAAELRVVAAMLAPLLAQLRRSAAGGHAAGGTAYELVGESDGMAEVRRLVERVAPTRLSVLVLGETGTGKEMVARALHASSPRAPKPMVALNCSAVPASLLAAELFGVTKGAFTGATADRPGKIEQADGSTLFLDEVGDMPAEMQAALLRALEERAVTRVGDGQRRPVDFRLVAATHQNLEADVEAGKFRRDLFFRLQELTITLPPLRDRDDDVLLLAQLFIHKAARELDLNAPRLTASARQALRRHTFPGNVRELRAMMRRAVLLAGEDGLLGADDLQLGVPEAPAGGPGSDAGGDPLLPLAEAKERFVASYVRRALDAHDGNREATASSLGISLRSLYRYLGGS